MDHKIGLTWNRENYLSAHTANILKLARIFHGKTHGSSFLRAVEHVIQEENIHCRLDRSQ